MGNKGGEQTTTKPDPVLNSYRDRYLNSAFGNVIGQTQRFYGVPGYSQQLPFGGFANPHDDKGGLRPNAVNEAATVWRNANGQPVAPGTPGAVPSGGGGGGDAVSMDSSGRPRTPPSPGTPPGVNPGENWNAPPMFAPGSDPWIAQADNPNDYRDMFENPYQDEVIGGVQKDFDRQRTMLGNRVNDLATKARAFGGSRHAVLEGEGLRDIGDNEGRTIGGLRYTGFNDAMDRATTERNKRLGIRQEEINAGRYRFDEAQNFGWNQLAKLGNVVNGVPAGSQSYRPYTWKDSAEAAGNLGQGAGGLFGG